MTVVGGHATVGRLSKNDFSTFQAIRNFFEKSRWTVTRQWSEVTRPSADCQTTFFVRFKWFGKILKKVAERSRDSGWGHATVGRLSNNVFSTLQAIWENFWKKSLNGHATVVGGHATVGRRSYNDFSTFQAIRKFFEKSRWTVTRQWLRSRDRRPTVKQRFWTFQAIRKKFEKSRWTVTRQWSEVTRPSTDCQTTIFRRFKQLEIFFWKMSLNGHATVVGGHATVGPTDKQRFLYVSSDLGKFWKKSLNGHATVVEVTRPSADCQTTFFRRFKRFGKIVKKVAERSRDSGWGHATVGRLSNNVFWTFQAIWENFEKSRWTVTRQWSRSRDRRPTVKQRFWMFQAIGKFCEISHWTVTRQWSEVTRPSADCQTTFLDVSSN